MDQFCTNGLIDWQFDMLTKTLDFFYTIFFTSKLHNDFVFYEEKKNVNVIIQDLEIKSFFFF